MTKKATINEAKALEYRPAATLVPYARNSRTHSDNQVAQIAAGIKEFGWTNPILTDGNGIVAGHGRLMAAQRLYDAGEDLYMAPGKEHGGALIPSGMVPILDCTGWSDAKRRAYVIADNKLALNAGWDVEMLLAEIDELKLSDVDVSLTGFEPAEIDALLPKEPPIDEDGPKVPDDEKFCLLIEYDNESQLQRAFEKAQQDGWKCKILS